jgi:hypothetical protein
MKLRYTYVTVFVVLNHIVLKRLVLNRHQTN